MSDTIYALSSGAGPAGVAVIRVSGTAAGKALRAITRRDPPAPRHAARTKLFRPRNDDWLDDGMVLWFPAPHSYTGEDVAELQIHGGPAVIAAMLGALGEQPGLRLAEPGEFTRRAFLNGRLDLTEAEGVADLVAAETEAQRRQALRQAEGELGRLYDGWRERLVPALAHLEAAIDFPDEDLPTDVRERLEHEILALVDAIFQHLDDSGRGERVRQGLDIAIIGLPNAGKSSLLNLLARRDAAIVSATAGTTRDVIEVQMDLGGYPVMLADTAGLREVSGEVEQEGVRRARRRAETADLKIAVFDANDAPGMAKAAEIVDQSTIAVLNKIDLGQPARTVDLPALQIHSISVITGEGVEGFLDGLQTAVEGRVGLTAQPALTRARHREALTDCLEALKRAGDVRMPELAAEDLRLAVRALGRITGRVDVEDLLDVIFRDFCIGK